MSVHLIHALLAAASLLLLPALAGAKTYSVPDPDPVAVVTLPDDWHTSEIRRGVESHSKDYDVYVLIEGTELGDADQMIADSVDWLKGKGAVVDQSTKERRPFSVNGLQGVQVKWSGKDASGPTSFTLTLLQVTDTKGLVVTFWGTAEDQKKHLEALVAIMDSLKAAQ